MLKQSQKIEVPAGLLGNILQYLDMQPRGQVNQLATAVEVILREAQQKTKQQSEGKDNG